MQCLRWDLISYLQDMMALQQWVSLHLGMECLHQGMDNLLQVMAIIRQEEVNLLQCNLGLILALLEEEEELLLQFKKMITFGWVDKLLLILLATMEVVNRELNGEVMLDTDEKGCR